MTAQLERLREDRLLRWSAYVVVPYLWFAVALFNPLLLLGPPLLVFALWKAVGYGMIERFETPPDPDLL